MGPSLYGALLLPLLPSRWIANPSQTCSPGCAIILDTVPRRGLELRSSPLVGVRPELFVVISMESLPGGQGRSNTQVVTLHTRCLMQPVQVRFGCKREQDGAGILGLTEGGLLK